MLQMELIKKLSIRKQTKMNLFHQKLSIRRLIKINKIKVVSKIMKRINKINQELNRILKKIIQKKAIIHHHPQKFMINLMTN